MDKDKYVDESWKESASQEKEKLDQVSVGQESVVQSTDESSPQQQEPSASSDAHPDQEPAAEAKEIEVTFMNYITSLAFQTMVFLGEIPNPITNEMQQNLDQAKLMIDTLLMLKEKTKGNLNEQEESLFSATVYELQVKFVEKLQKGESVPQEGDAQ